MVCYRYVWEIDGETVRDVVTAGHADAIPRGIAALGSLLECHVTPSDGRLDGPSAGTAVIVPEPQRLGTEVVALLSTGLAALASRVRKGLSA